MATVEKKTKHHKAEDHVHTHNGGDGKQICACVDCVKSKIKHVIEITEPCTTCVREVQLTVTTNCSAKREITDTWSHIQTGHKCEEIEPEPLPCDELPKCDRKPHHKSSAIVAPQH